MSDPVQVPDGWEFSRFDQFAVLQRGFDLPVQNRIGGIFPIIGSNGIVGYHNECKVDAPGVVTGRSGSIGEVFFVKNDFWALNTSLYVKEFYGNDERYTYYFLQHFDLTRFGTGTGVPTLNRNNVHSEKIIIPPLPEQKKIASILTSVDDVIEKTEAQISKLQDLKKGMMTELLTKGIGHTEFKDSPVGRIPKSWDVDNLGEISEFVTSGSRGWAQYYAQSGELFIRITNLTRKHINFDLTSNVYVEPPNSAEGKRTLVRQGDILISITADLGIIGVIPASFPKAYVNQHISLVRLKEHGGVLSRYIGHFLCHDMVQEQFRGNNDPGAKSGLNLASIRLTTVAIPPILEQERIVENLDHVDVLILKKQKKLSQTKALKKALMNDLLTGKKRVNINN
jgi:type I restriction enzyme, S subunit